MVAIDYRVLLDGKPASRDQLDQLETVTVEQQIDMAWQARLEIPICTDDRGRWQGADQPFTTPFARVRVEVRFGSGAFIPLIDGPVVGSDNQMSSQPGQSSFILIVHDASAHLNRTERLQRFDNRPDHQIAKDLLQSVPQIATTDIDQTPAAPSGQSTAVVQRGTAMQLLRRLARRQGMHAYVLPGPQAGQSIGAFKQPQTKGDGLPDLVLVGTDRNVAAFNVRADDHRPATVRTPSRS